MSLELQIKEFRRCGICALLLLVIMSTPSLASDELKEYEKAISNEIYDIEALLKNDALDLDVYEESRKKLILLKSRYERVGGDDYRYILPSELIINDANLRAQETDLRVDAYKSCVIEFASMRKYFDLKNYCQSISQVGPSLTLNVNELFSGITAVLSSDKKLSQADADEILEKHFQSIDEKNKKIYIQAIIEKLEDRLRQGEIENNGESFAALLLTLIEQGITQETQNKLKALFVKRLNELANEDIEAQRLSKPVENNALSKYENIFKLDGKNPEAKEGITNIALAYIEMAESSAEKGKTAQVKNYLNKAISVQAGVISTSDFSKVIQKSENKEISIKNKLKQEAAKQEEARKEKELNLAAEQAKRDAEVARPEAIQRQIQQEQEGRDAPRVQGIVDQYLLIIQQRIKRYWTLPTNFNDGLECIVRVQLVPGGGLKSVRIINSSGNALFDRSVENAVYKAAPFPQPSEPKAAEALRDFQFIFKPD